MNGPMNGPMKQLWGESVDTQTLGGGLCGEATVRAAVRPRAGVGDGGCTRSRDASARLALLSRRHGGVGAALQQRASRDDDGGEAGDTSTDSPTVVTVVSRRRLHSSCRCCKPLATNVFNDPTV